MPGRFKPNSKRMKEKLEELAAHARQLGGELLSTEYETSKSKLRWKCERGHVWESSRESVFRLGTWCPTCSGNQPRSLDELRGIAEARGGRLLSDVYGNVDTSYDFECSKGHLFSNSFSHIVRGGQWCPTCNKGSKSEELARVAFEHVFSEPFPKKRPKWLRNERNNQMELDGYSEKLGIAFEYQGIQHFTKSLFGNSVQQRIRDDSRKRQLCEENGVLLFYLTHEMPYITFVEEIRKQCLKFNLSADGLNFDDNADFNKAYIRDDRLEKLILIVEKNGIEVLSTKWIGTKDFYKFHCRVCDHIWEAQGTAFFNSRRVAGCDRCARAKFGKSRLLGIEALQLYAKRHGGICLSTEYIRRNYTYEWKCSEGHVFLGNFNNMKFRNKFCPECA